MKQILSLVLCFLVCGALPLRAEDTSTLTAAGTEGWKSGLEADKAKIAEEKLQIKTNATAARAEEKDLHQQIRDAQAAGDTAKVESLRTQLKATHQENAGQMRQDKQELGAAKKELRTDRKEAWKGRADRNKDGKVDRVERNQAKKRGR